MQNMIRTYNNFLNCDLFFAPTFNYKYGNNHVTRSKVLRIEMLQWPGYKLSNSGVHGLGLAPRVWLITDCNHCKVTLILQRSPIICDWSNVPSLHDLLFSWNSRYLCLYNKRASQKLLIDFYKFLDFNIKKYKYNYIQNI